MSFRELIEALSPDEIEKITGEKEQMIVRITEYQPKTHEQVKAALGIK